jgi:hypothetical protein
VHRTKNLIAVVQALSSKVTREVNTATEFNEVLGKRLQKKGWVIFEAEMLTKSWSSMFDTIMSGKNAAELQGYANSFELMGKTPENVERFNTAMVDHTRLVTPDILRSYDFIGISHLMADAKMEIGFLFRQAIALLENAFRTLDNFSHLERPLHFQGL